MHLSPVLYLFALTLVSGGPVHHFKRNEEYDRLVTQGQGRWDRLQTRLQDKTALDEEPLDCVESPHWWVRDGQLQAQASSPAARLSTMIDDTELDISKDANFFEIHMGYPYSKDRPKKLPTSNEESDIRYDNYYNPKEGIIVAQDLWKGRNVQDPAPYSRPTWTMWQRFNERAQTKAGDLRGVVHYACVNPAAETVAEELCRDQGKTQTLDPSKDADKDKVHAILATPNSASVLGLLMYHKNALNAKSIKSITVWCPKDKVMGLYYNLG